MLADTEALGITIVIDDQLLVSGHAKGANLAIRQIEEIRVDVPMLALTHCDSADIIQATSAKRRNTPCAPASGHRAFPTAMTCSVPLPISPRPYEAEYSYAPPYQAAKSAAAVMVFADAFERVGTFDKAAVRDALADTVMETFYSNIDFDETGASSTPNLGGN